MWTEERVWLLRKLWAEGYSASQIAAQLGGCTRNACIGKVHRLGLARGGVVHAAKNAANERRARQARAKRKPQKVAAQATESMSLRKALILSLEPLDDSTRVAAVTRRQCRYVHGDPAKQWAYCGRGKQAGSPYCEHHTQLCYVVKQKREQGKVA